MLFDLNSLLAGVNITLLLVADTRVRVSDDTVRHIGILLDNALNKPTLGSSSRSNYQTANGWKKWLHD